MQIIKAEVLKQEEYKVQDVFKQDENNMNILTIASVGIVTSVLSGLVVYFATKLPSAEKLKEQRDAKIKDIQDLCDKNTSIGFTNLDPTEIEHLQTTGEHNKIIEMILSQQEYINELKNHKTDKAAPAKIKIVEQLKKLLREIGELNIKLQYVSSLNELKDDDIKVKTEEEGDLWKPTGTKPSSDFREYAQRVQFAEDVYPKQPPRPPMSTFKPTSSIDADLSVVADAKK
jgi:hypothetical protein